MRYRGVILFIFIFCTNAGEKSDQMRKYLSSIRPIKTGYSLVFKDELNRGNEVFLDSNNPHIIFDLIGQVPFVAHWDNVRNVEFVSLNSVEGEMFINIDSSDGRDIQILLGVIDKKNWLDVVTSFADPSKFIESGK